MKRLIVMGSMVVALVALSARPASAQVFIMKWLEGLSGPGPIKGVGAQVSLYCLPESGEGEFGPFCDTNALTSVKRFVGLEIGFGRGDHNLTYPAGADVDESVSALSILGTYDYRVNRALDLGTGAGFLRLWGSAESPTKLLIEPHILVRPFVNSEAHWIVRGIGLRGSVLYIPQGYTLEDFGATGGDLRGDSEFVVNVAVTIGLRPPR
jgi:hypothetical protein